MPCKATGNTYQKGEHWYARITLDATTRPKIALPTCKTAGAAEARRAVLADFAKSLRGVNVPVDVARTFLLRAGEAAEGKALDKVRRTIDAVCSGEARPIADPSKPKTFRDVGERWTSGDLARLYPDHVKVKKSTDLDRGRLERYIYPLLEGVTIEGFTLDDAERVMRALPHKEPSTRRRFALLLHRVLSLGVFPLRLRADNPLPRGFLPKNGSEKAKAYLYPDEDQELLGCTDVPLPLRLLYGFLDREGCRASEAIGFDISDADLDRGAIKLDENKTDDPRAWALGADVARALRASITLREEALGDKLRPNDPLFVDVDGERILPANMASRFRAELQRAGIERAELYESNDARRRIRLHDTPATSSPMAAFA
jgi:integrase